MLEPYFSGFGEDPFPDKSLQLSSLSVLLIVRASTPLQIKSEAIQYLIVSNILTIIPKKSNKYAYFINILI